MLLSDIKAIFDLATRAVEAIESLAHDVQVVKNHLLDTEEPEFENDEP